MSKRISRFLQVNEQMSQLFDPRLNNADGMALMK